MTDSTVSERDLAINRVMKSLARVRSQGNVLTVRDARGVAPIIITLPDDAVGDTEDRVVEMGGAANVVLAYPDRFMIWSWDSSVVLDADTIDVHENSTMDMLHVWIMQCAGETTNLNLVRSSLTQQRELSYQV